MPVLVSSPAPPSLFGPDNDELRIVNMDGSVVSTIQNFQVNQVEWQLNNMGLLQFTIATAEPSFAPYGILGPTYELQYYRRGNLWWWGIIVDSELQGDGSQTQVTCYGILWYAHKRFFGMANRVNWVKGYSLKYGFTQPASSFTAVSTTASFPVPPSALIGQAHTNYAILSAVPGTHKFTISGNWTGIFTVASKIKVVGGANAGTYTISAVSYTTYTIITVSETIPSSSAAGYITPVDATAIFAGKYTVVELSGVGGANQPAGEDAYWEQSITFNNPANGSGDGPWTPQAPGIALTAYYYLINFTGPAANFPGGLGATMRGLWMGLYEVDGTTPIYVIDGNVKSGAAVSVAQITKSTQIGTWVRLQTGLVPPDRTFVLKYRFYAPGGKILWGGLSVTQQDGYYPSPDGEDENIVVQRIAQIGMQPTTLLNPEGTGPDNLQFMDTSKTDLNMQFNCPTMSQHRTATYPYANHQNILEALLDWTTEYQGVDMEIMFSTPTQRIFTTWGNANNGRKGVFYPKMPLVIGGNVVISQSQMSANAENGGNNVLEIGVDDSTASDQGSANVEGGSFDNTLFGGKDIEIVESAPNDVTIGKLNALAQQRQQSINGVPLAPVLRTLVASSLLGPILIGSYGLKVGDLVPVFGQYGWMQFNGQVLRIAQIDMYPDEGDVADFTLNLPDPYAQVPSPV